MPRNASRSGRNPDSPSASRAKKGVDPSTVREAAFRLLAEAGESGFGVRPLAARLGLDPMTVLHHGGSREQLLRMAADRMLAELPGPVSEEDWRARLHAVAAGFRGLARRYPSAFPAIIRFQATGPADYRLGEVVYEAMLEAGLVPQDAAELGLAFYALIIGFALSEVAGMLRPSSAQEAVELAALPAAEHPATRALIPAFASICNDRMFLAAVDAFLAGVAHRTQASAASPAS